MTGHLTGTKVECPKRTSATHQITQITKAHLLNLWIILGAMSYGPLDFVGNVGVIVLMITYLMLQLNKLRSDGLAYSVLNAVGASFIVVSLVYDFNLSALLMEVFWVLISFVGIFRYFRLKQIKSA